MACCRRTVVVQRMERGWDIFVWTRSFSLSALWMEMLLNHIEFLGCGAGCLWLEASAWLQVTDPHLNQTPRHADADLFTPRARPFQNKLSRTLRSQEYRAYINYFPFIFVFMKQSRSSMDSRQLGANYPNLGQSSALLCPFRTIPRPSSTLVQPPYPGYNLIIPDPGFHPT
ncbi:hypothetical protein VTK26DRAFT_8232 [Humicola hyalothermophila]